MNDMESGSEEDLVNCVKAMEDATLSILANRQTYLGNPGAMTTWRKGAYLSTLARNEFNQMDGYGQWNFDSIVHREGQPLCVFSMELDTCSDSTD